MRLGHALRLNNQSNIVSDWVGGIMIRHRRYTPSLRGDLMFHRVTLTNHSVFQSFKRQVSENVSKEYCVWLTYFNRSILYTI